MVGFEGGVQTSTLLRCSHAFMFSLHRIFSFFRWIVRFCSFIHLFRCTNENTAYTLWLRGEVFWKPSLINLLAGECCMRSCRGKKSVFCWPHLGRGLGSPGAHFSKAPVTFRARNQIFKSKYKE